MGSEKEPRLTGPTLRVLKLFLENPDKVFSGADITRAIGTPSGTLYPILMRLERAGWLGSQWESLDPAESGRPRRRYYELTAIGERKALAALRELVPTHARPAWI